MRSFLFNEASIVCGVMAVFNVISCTHKHVQIRLLSKIKVCFILKMVVSVVQVSPFSHSRLNDC